MKLATLLALVADRPESLNRDHYAEIAAEHMHECVQLAVIGADNDANAEMLRNALMMAEHEQEGLESALAASEKLRAALEAKLNFLEQKTSSAREALTP